MSISPPVGEFTKVASRLLIAWIVLGLLLGIGALLPRPAAALNQDIDLPDTLLFSPDTFAVDPGESVSLRLETTGILIHSFTLFDEVDANVPVTDFTALTAYNASHDKIADVWLLGGMVKFVNFTAPSTPGTYTYVCMVAGHAAAGMIGTMVVRGGGMEGDGVGIDPILIGIIVAVVAVVVIVAVFLLMRSRG